MGEFVDNLSDLTPGEQVVVTMTGAVYDTIYLGVRIDTPGDTWTVNQESIDTGAASVERIELDETKRLEPGVYSWRNWGIYYIKVSDDLPIILASTAVGTCKFSSMIDDKEILRGLETGKCVKVS